METTTVIAKVGYVGALEVWFHPVDALGIREGFVVTARVPSFTELAGIREGQEVEVRVQLVEADGVAPHLVGYSVDRVMTRPLYENLLAFLPLASAQFEVRTYAQLITWGIIDAAYEAIHGALVDAANRVGLPLDSMHVSDALRRLEREIPVATPIG